MQPQSPNKILTPPSDEPVNAALAMIRDAILVAEKRINLKSSMQTDFDVRSLTRDPESYRRQHIPNLLLAAQGIPSCDYLDQWRLEGPM